MGQLLGIIRKSEFIDAWGKAKQKDYLSIRLLNLDELSKLRNPLIHEGAQSTSSQAFFLYHSLYLLIESFGVESLEEGSLSDLNAFPELPKLDNPYLGLEAFRQAHAKQFFGRETKIQALREVVAQRAFVAVIGNSGSGKSSLVFAGLIPTLTDWLIIECRPRNQFFYTLASALVDGLYQNEINQIARMQEITALENLLATQPALLTDSLRRIQVQHSQYPRVLLVIDQFEELYTLNPPAVQHSALESLLYLLDNAKNCCLLITLRADFLGQALNSPRLTEWLDADRHKLLGNLDETGLLAAIIRPLEVQGLRFEDGLPKRIVRELGDTPGQLPLLQFTLRQLWAQRDGEVLTHARYEDLGGVSQALARRADNIYQSLSDEGRIALRRLLIQLIQPGEGTEDTRKIIALNQVTDPAQQALIQRLSDENERLLVTGENTLEVAHESLIRHWTLVREWMKDDRPFRVWQKGLQHYLQDQTLLSGAALATAQEWLSKRGEEIHADEQELIARSVEKIAREEAEKRRNQHRWAMFVLAFFIVALGLSSLAAWFWWTSKDNAQEAKKHAQIAEQNQQRATQKAEESAQNAAEAQEKFTQSLINQSHMLAGFAEISLKENKPATAMRLALEALPGTSESHPRRTFVAPAYDFLSRAINRQYQGVLQHDKGVGDAVFSSDGTRLLTRSGKFAYLWDIATRQLLCQLKGHVDQVNFAAFSADSKRVVTASDDKTARLWDADMGVQLAVLQGHESPVTSAAFSPDGTQVVTASSDKTARIWDADTGAQLAVLQGYNSAAFSPDGTRVVTASWDNTARLWDTDTGAQLAVMQGHEKWVKSAAFSSDGKRVVTASWDNTARLWNADTGAQLAVLQHGDSVNSAAFSPDGRRIITASGPDISKYNIARLWDADTGTQLAMLQGHKNRITSAVFNSDGTRVVTASWDNTARLWDANTGAQLVVLQGHENWVNSAAFSPDGTQVVTTSNDKSTRLWDADTGTQLAVMQGHEDWVKSAAFSPDGTQVVTASIDKTARIWDANIGGQLVALQGHERGVHSAAFSPDGKRVVTVSRDDTARLWDADTGKELVRLQGHESFVQSAAFSPDGRRVITASGSIQNPVAGKDNTARLWDADTGTQLAVMQGHEAWINSAAFSPDGKRVITASWDKTARLWNTDTGQELAKLQGHESVVFSAAFSPDGRRVITASDDKTARLWDADTGTQLAVLQGHGSFVTSAAFSSDGTRVITASNDDTARLWDTDTGAQLAVLQGYTAAFSPDGTRVVTASDDNTARIWITFSTLEEMIAYAQKMLPPRDSKNPGDVGIPGWRLTCAERRQFFLEEVDRCKSAAIK